MVSVPQNPCGITYYPNERTHYANALYFSLERLFVHADIVDVTAIVTITQIFLPPYSEGTFFASYRFPVPERAAVCGFEMRTDTGVFLEGVALEKEQARKAYNQAVVNGEMAALLDKVENGVFSVALGHISSKQMTTTKLTYVTDLFNLVFTDQVRLTLPVHIGQDLGTRPSTILYSSHIPSGKISITINIRVNGTIRSIVSPSHPETTLSSEGSDNEQLPPYQQVAGYRSTAFLARDYVLVITVDGLDNPACFAEHHPSGSLAMRLSINPAVSIPLIPAQEYIFLVDCSASMIGERIKAAAETLVLLLHALPSEGTKFNIFKFGMRYDSLWATSAEYNAETLKTACLHVDAMAANYGGTDIHGALNTALQSRQHDHPTACFLLTDGEVFYNASSIIHDITASVAEAREHAPVRIFTLGIGASASTAMCQDIARAGNGACLMATETDTMVAKCAKLVRASRTPAISNLSVSWNLPRTSSRRCWLRRWLFPETFEQTEMMQSPTHLPKFTGSRFTTFALVPNANGTPQRVTVLGRYDDGSLWSKDIPVQILPSATDVSQLYMINVLAAQHVIRDLETAYTKDGKTKKQIIELAKRYQLTSVYTSIVAVDKDKHPVLTSWGRPQRDHGPDLKDASASRTRSRLTLPLLSLRRNHDATVPSPKPQPASASTAPSSDAKAIEKDSSRKSGKRHDTNMSAANYDPTIEDRSAEYRVLCLHSPRQEEYAVQSSDPPQRLLYKVPMTQTGFTESYQPWTAPEGTGVDSYDPTISPYVTDSATTRDVISGYVLALIRRQEYDGSFPANSATELILGREAMEEGRKFRPKISDKVWATALAIAFLQKHLTAQNDLLYALLDKATKFIRQANKDKLDLILAQAKLAIER